MDIAGNLCCPEYALSSYLRQGDNPQKLSILDIFIMTEDDFSIGVSLSNLANKIYIILEKKDFHQPDRISSIIIKNLMKFGAIKKEYITEYSLGQAHNVSIFDLTELGRELIIFHNKYREKNS